MNKIPITEVLAWLEKHQPELRKTAEIERDWVWLVADLRGEDNKATREAIGAKGIGFRFCGKPHLLPSGNTSHWSHCCEHPIAFKRSGRTSDTKQPRSETKPNPRKTSTINQQTQTRHDPLADRSSLAELASAVFA